LDNLFFVAILVLNSVVAANFVIHCEMVVTIAKRRDLSQTAAYRREQPEKRRRSICFPSAKASMLTNEGPHQSCRFLSRERFDW
jgi:hypothetical protein